MTSTPFLKISGNQLVDGSGAAVILRGFGLGGWLNMENFITGYPANEEAQRQALLQALGPEKYAFFFDRFLTYFFTEDDARFVKSLGLNLIRIPVNYRHLEDDMAPFVIKEEGFRHLDRAIELCAAQGIYTIIDLHALPGYQNGDWHSDNPTHKAFFWQHKHFQDRTVGIWEAIARRYRDNPWVAGYNPINEPYDPSEQLIMPIYRRLVDAIQAIDPNHLIFLEGNRYSLDFHMFGEPWPGVVYTNHDYAAPGFVDGGPYPGISRGPLCGQGSAGGDVRRSLEVHVRPQDAGLGGRVRPGLHRRSRGRCDALPGAARSARHLPALRRELVDLALQGHRPAGGGLRGGGQPVAQTARSVHGEEGSAGRGCVGQPRYRASAR